MLVGYARVSTTDQHLDLQHDTLKQSRCEKTFEDTMSGAKAERPGLQHALAYLREGDTLMVGSRHPATTSTVADAAASTPAPHSGASASGGMSDPRWAPP
jgi:predicted site-specific integrase-resolvase